MTRAAHAAAAVETGSRGGLRRKAVGLLRGGMEAVVLTLVVLSPWAFGAVEPAFELALLAGVAALLALWGARMLLEWRLRWAKCPVALCLAALYIGGTWQLSPWPRDMLAWLSPASARMYDQLLPAAPEVLPFGEEMPAVQPPAGSTISLYPGATRAELIRLLAVFLLFAAVRMNVASAAGLRRLGLVALANGTLLALFGVVQFFTAPANTIYWSFPTEGIVFGPFVNRNHFAFYLNVCVGLGLGLLLNRFSRRGRALGWDAGPSGTAWGDRWGSDRFRAALHLLLDPQALGMSFALALMLGSVVFCLSRGGFLALLGGASVGLTILLTRPDRSLRRGAALLPLGMALLTLAVLALALVAWFGMTPVLARVASLWNRQDLPGGRVALWARVLPLVGEFPLWGTGDGTFRYLEPLHAAAAADAELEYTFAHNDYLEAMLEGGLARLVPSVVAVALVFRLGVRAVRRQEGRSTDGLALGALVGFTTVAIHSAVEFGLHIPAIALLATVLCAHLCALGGGEGRGSTYPGEDGDPGEYVLRLGGLAPLVGAATAVALGVVLVTEGARAARAEPFLASAAGLRERTDRPGRERRLADLEVAARLVPEDARLQVRLARAHLAIHQDGLEAIEKGDRLADAIQVAVIAVDPNLAAVPVQLLAARARTEVVRNLEGRLDEQHLMPALGHFLQARDLCPLLAEPHLGIASHLDARIQSEPRSAYLARAKRLAPVDPQLWYLYGIEELLEGRPEQAWKSWRRCLELSDRYRPTILALCAEHLGPDEMIRRVLPNRPDLLLAAAVHLHPRPDATEDRRPFLERALALLAERPAALKPDDLHLQALIHASLDQPDAALASYEAALAREPLQVEWRYEFARLLHQQGRSQEAQRELRTVLALQPDHAPARALRDAVARRVAEEK